MSYHSYMTRTRIFADKKVLDKMIRLRRNGWSLSKLAVHFNCDHTSIIYQLRKHNIIKPKVRKTISVKERVRHEVTKKAQITLNKNKYDHLWEEPVNSGKDYATLVRESHERELRRREAKRPV